MGLERVFSGNELLLPSHYLRLLLCLVALGAQTNPAVDLLCAKYMALLLELMKDLRRTPEPSWRSCAHRAHLSCSAQTDLSAIADRPLCLLCSARIERMVKGHERVLTIR